MLSQQIQTAADMRAHVWFADIQWNDLKSKRLPPPIKPVAAVRVSVHNAHVCKVCVCKCVRVNMLSYVVHVR